TQTAFLACRTRAETSALLGRACAVRVRTVVRRARPSPLVGVSIVALYLPRGARSSALPRTDHILGPARLRDAVSRGWRTDLLPRYGAITRAHVHVRRRARSSSIRRARSRARSSWSSARV